MRLRVGAGVLLLAMAAVATRPEVSVIAEQLELRRYYLDGEVDVDVNEMERLVATYPEVSFVGLTEDWEDGNDALAADLLNQLGRGTLLVRSPSEVGAVSSIYGDEALNRALDAVAATSGSDYITDFQEFAGALGEPPTELSLGWILFGVAVLATIFLVWRGWRRRGQEREDQLEQARAEIRSQMDHVANQILKMADDPRLVDNPPAEEHYRSASEVFRAAEERFAGVSDLTVLEDLSDDLDQARWELEAAQALIEGRSPPVKPAGEKPSHCFFDPTHGAGVEEAVLNTPAGEKKVWVCRADAERLRQGQTPEPRTIPMGPSQVPAPRAPRSHGGLGLDWLDVFSVIVGGMGQGRSYDWTGSAPPRGSRGGFGFPRPSGGRRSTSTPSIRPKGRARRRL
ncbi:MAG TPA: hypothetical protein VJR05_01575 [Acidimicrobiia bacterium]|nr:hypothetical protein [Acidimicrobiia bacterium]